MCFGKTCLTKRLKNVLYITFLSLFARLARFFYISPQIFETLTGNMQNYFQIAMAFDIFTLVRYSKWPVWPHIKLLLKWQYQVFCTFFLNFDFGDFQTTATWLYSSNYVSFKKCLKDRTKSKKLNVFQSIRFLTLIE